MSSAAVAAVGVAEAIPLRTASQRTVFCTEVVEQVRDERLAAKELARVLAPGGVVLVSVPFVHGLHEWPHDYRRFTIFGIRRVLKEAGLGVEGVWVVGGPAAVATDTAIRIAGRVGGAVRRRLPIAGRFADRYLVSMRRIAACVALRQTTRWRVAADAMGPPLALGYVVVARAPMLASARKD